MEPIAQHYTSPGLLAAIRDGLRQMGKTPHTVTADELAAVDQFHVGGQVATERFLDHLASRPPGHLLDLGCGLGGAARQAAARFGHRVTGVDLTAAFVEVGTRLSQWVGLADRVTLVEGDVTALPFEAASFDGAFMLHAGMNIADKRALGRAVYRVLRPGSLFGIYDLMRQSDEDLTYPVPWASEASTNHAAWPEVYVAALEEAGFHVRRQQAWGDLARLFTAPPPPASTPKHGPSPLGLHLVMGATAPAKRRHLAAALRQGLVVPVELIAERV
ncbi:MAG: class I SAM-dependent methyltransferase [Bacteroidota bacterium]